MSILTWENQTALGQDSFIRTYCVCSQLSTTTAACEALPVTNHDSVKILLGFEPKDPYVVYTLATHEVRASAGGHHTTPRPLRFAETTNKRLLVFFRERKRSFHT